MSKQPGTFAFFDQRSIRYPLFRLILIVFLAGTSLAFVSDAVLMLGNVRKDIHRTLLGAANAAGTAANAAVAFKDTKAAHDILRMFEVYPEVEAAALYTSDGALLASYGNVRLLPTSAHKIVNSPENISLMAETGTVSEPIQIDGVAIGTVWLRARLKVYWHTYLTSIATSIAVSVFAGALTLILAMRFLDNIILPVGLLGQAAKDARLRKDFRPRAIPAADNEIGDLVRNFNALLSEVEAGRRSLQSHQEELERLVADRTGELLSAKLSADAANDAKSRFLAAASHDLRQPIHAMRLFIDALATTPLNTEQRRIADYLSLSTHNLADMLNTLLDISRLDSGMVTPHLEPVSSLKLMGDIESEFAPLALAKGLRFKLFLPVRELTLHTDARLLYSLLRNLIDNAIKYTEHGGVLVGIRRRSDCAVIQVWDTGIGIAEDDLKAIFDEYFQVGNPQRDSTKGLGLGLAIVQRMASILRLRMNCRSRLNRGSMFEVTLPLAEPAGPAMPTSPTLPIRPAVVPLPAAMRKVVVLEDDKIVATALSLALGAQGLTVAQFSSAEQALKESRLEDADFFVVDYRLPGLNGVQFLDEVQKRAGRPINAVLVTGEACPQGETSQPETRWKLLIKPIDVATLMAAIAAQTTPAGDPAGPDTSTST